MHCNELTVSIYSLEISLTQVGNCPKLEPWAAVIIKNWLITIASARAVSSWWCTLRLKFRPVSFGNFRRRGLSRICTFAKFATCSPSLAPSVLSPAERLSFILIQDAVKKTRKITASSQSQGVSTWQSGKRCWEIHLRCFRLPRQSNLN